MTSPLQSTCGLTGHGAELFLLLNCGSSSWMGRCELTREEEPLQYKLHTMQQYTVQNITIQALYIYRVYLFICPAPKNVEDGKINIKKVNVEGCEVSDFHFFGRDFNTFWGGTSERIHPVQCSDTLCKVCMEWTQLIKI